MKNGKMKLNRTKIVARVMLIVLLLMSVLTLTACPGWNGRVDRTITFKTHKELSEFLETYGSKNDGFVETFVSFDFDNNKTVETFQYNFYTNMKIKRSWITGDIINYELYDKDHTNGFRCEMIFHIDEIDTQIKCEYLTRSKYNFYQYDKVSIMLLVSYHIDDFVEDDNYTDYQTFCNDFNDLRTFNTENVEYKDHYNYLYLYQIKVNGNEEVKVKITAKTELSQDKLDEISQLLLDNMVIINTEG